MNGNNNAYHVSNQVASTTNDQNKANNSSANAINNNEISVITNSTQVAQQSALPPPPQAPSSHNHSTQIKNDLMNNYWNNALGGGAPPTQANQGSSNSSRSPVDLTVSAAAAAYAAPPILCDNQNQNANTEMSRDMFVRSDSILTDDDYVPFDAPAQSKFGPISRMSAKTSPYSTGMRHQTQIANLEFIVYGRFADDLMFASQHTIDPSRFYSAISIGLSSDNLTAPGTAATSNDASVWLYNNLQKSPNQYSYQTTELNPMRGDNLSREGKGN